MYIVSPNSCRAFIQFAQVDLADLTNRAVYTNLRTTQTLRGDYTLGAVKVEGNAEVKLINDVDLNVLNQSVVKTSGDFTLSGKIKQVAAFDCEDKTA